MNQKSPLFTELIAEESAVVRGGQVPVFILETGKIIHADGIDKEVKLDAYGYPKADTVSSTPAYSWLALPASF
ncbi:hypothetical protein A6770_10870 [Nostoc minutum NIES-26]|uniref:Uncharacterized protein n=1 Tax=Nostoc minutum NIES-26 TaxID=1844469 RepID=A0A367RX33_9NOSO|nr:hypothetical protein A6770_10870 [Nostoc minutum NIES-26]